MLENNPNNTQPQPVDRQDLTIGLLVVTSLILGVAWLVAPSASMPAYASGISVTSGDYMMAATEVNQTEEIVYVIDASKSRMIIYYVDPRNNTLAIGDAEELAGLVDGGSAQPPAQQGTPKRQGGSRQAPTPRGRGTTPTP